MKYSFLTVKCRYGSDPTAYNYDMPIIGHQELYNRLPTPGTSIQIAEGRTTGYNSLTELFMPVCDALGFNPYKIKEFYINPAGLATMEPQIIDAFMGTYKEVSTNQANGYPDLTSANLIGYTYMGVGYSSAQATIAQTPYGGGTYFTIPFLNIMRENTYFTLNDGIRTSFEIWPATVIERGYIDTQHFEKDEGLLRIGYIHINIWYKASEEKYNFNIMLQSGNYTQARTDQILDNFEGAELGHVYDPANPYDNKQEDGDEGGNGDFDNENDPVQIPALPSIDITSLGGLHLFKVTPNDMASLFSYMTSNAPGDAILKWFSNPIQAISACYMLPYPVLAAGSAEITVLGIHTGVTGYTAAQWAEWNLGSVYIGQGFGDCFLDYSPYTRVSIYLPFIGVRQLTADDVIGHNVGVHYQFDNISGACVAYVTIDTAVRYSYVGSCAIGIPISQSNWGQTYMAAATSAAGAMAGGFSAAAGAIANGASGGAIIGQAAMGAVQGGGGLDAFNAKPNISRSGSMSGAGSAIGVNKPFMIIERPDKAKIEDPKNVIGITSGKTLSLGSLHGFNALESFHLDNIAATGEELTEIETLLHQGVIF